jgi:transposase
MMAKRKEWTAEEKLAIILDGFKGRSMTEICKEYGISDAQYYKWRDVAIESLKSGFQDKRKKEYRDTSAEAERNRMLKVIGEQQMIIDIQKKISQTL